MDSFISGNQITLLQNGEAYFPAIEAAFDRAVHEIYLETYIFQNDATGRRIAEALRRAAQRGVSTHLLIDGFGSKDLPQRMLDYLQEGGVKILKYRPHLAPWSWRRKHLRRLHRKVVVVDRQIAFVGGINIVDDVEPVIAPHPRYDYAVAVEGPLAQVIRRSARQLWSRVSWTHLQKGLSREKSKTVPSLPKGTAKLSFLVRDNIRHRRDIETAYLAAIEQAECEIIIANAYFLPGINFRYALVRAAERGVRVVLLLQGRAEYLLLHYATRALYGKLLDAGIEIYEYRKSLLHAKVAVIDGHWATVGSSNIDPFSLLLSREANIIADDEEFAATLRQNLFRAMEEGGQRIIKPHWKRYPINLRFMSWLSYGLLRIFTGVAEDFNEQNRVKPEKGRRRRKGTGK